ncbi:MAG: hypothetical protein BGO69_00555 [Bacteroidetes bacterium 46-16]|nr:MAG: hypothetical protein BGO69_00555 [Bacteroidetes bacterium 46-16]
MKKNILFSFIALCAIMVSCRKKDTENHPIPFVGTNAISYSWTLDKYDGVKLTGSQSGMLDASATSPTQGTAHFTRTLSTLDTNTEDVTYILSNGDTRVNFTKTNGNYGDLVSGGTWTIDSLTTSVMVIRSQYNLVMRFTR